MDAFTLEKTNRSFDSEQKCAAYLHALRWGSHFRCPYCQSDRAWQISDTKYKCQDCGAQTSLTSGTALQRTHLSLCAWFQAVWYMVNQQGGTNALELEKHLNLGSNRTALAVVNRIRETMGTLDADKLYGSIYIDEIPVKAKAASPSALIGVAANTPEGFQIRIGFVDSNHQPEDYRNFVLQYVQTGSVIHARDTIETGWHIVGYKYHGDKRKAGSRWLPVVDDVLHELRNRGLLGKKQVSCTSKQMDNYLKECCYKYNRKDAPPETLFQEILRGLVHANKR